MEEGRGGGDGEAGVEEANQKQRGDYDEWAVSMGDLSWLIRNNAATGMCVCVLGVDSRLV